MIHQCFTVQEVLLYIVYTEQYCNGILVLKYVRFFNMLSFYTFKNTEQRKYKFIDVNQNETIPINRCNFFEMLHPRYSGKTGGDDLTLAMI